MNNNFQINLELIIRDIFQGYPKIINKKVLQMKNVLQNQIKNLNQLILLY